MRRGQKVGPRSPNEPVGDWLARLHHGRHPKDHLGNSPLDDVADPVGQGGRVYQTTARELAALTTSLVDLLWPDVPVEASA